MDQVNWRWVCTEDDDGVIASDPPCGDIETGEPGCSDWECIAQQVDKPHGEYLVRACNAFPALLAACEALPDFDIDSPDAADFKDHASEFMEAMRLARAAIAQARGA